MIVTKSKAKRFIKEFYDGQGIDATPYLDEYAELAFYAQCRIIDEYPFCEVWYHSVLNEIAISFNAGLYHPTTLCLYRRYDPFGSLHASGWEFIGRL